MCGRIVLPQPGFAYFDATGLDESAILVHNCRRFLQPVRFVFACIRCGAQTAHFPLFTLSPWSSSLFSRNTMLLASPKINSGGPNKVMSSWIAFTLTPGNCASVSLRALSMVSTKMRPVRALPWPPPFSLLQIWVKPDTFREERI